MQKFQADQPCTNGIAGGIFLYITFAKWLKSMHQLFMQFTFVHMSALLLNLLKSIVFTDWSIFSKNNSLLFQHSKAFDGLKIPYSGKFLQAQIFANAPQTHQEKISRFLISRQGRDL